MKRVNKQVGFTLIELLLAMAFLTFLLLFMITATVQVMRSYNKGLTLKQINQTGRLTLEEVTRLIRTSDASSINTNELANKRLCISGVSYVWNEKDANVNRYTDNTRIGLARMNDPSGSMCGPGLPRVPLGADTVEQLNSRVWVQSFNVTPSLDRQLADVNLTLSTSDDNQPFFDTTTGSLSCGPDTFGHFCAFSAFSTTVNTRSGSRE